MRNTMQKDAIEAVADKRYDRLALGGMTANEAGKLVASWLRSVAGRHPMSICWCEALACGYEVKI